MSGMEANGCAPSADVFLIPGSSSAPPVQVLIYVNAGGMAFVADFLVSGLGP
jgi:hypothetical protein